MRFDSTILAMGNNTGIEIPPEVIEGLGAGKRPPVVVSVNGYEYRSTVAVMGGTYLVPFSSDKRAATGLAGGDTISVEVTHDTAPRMVEVPDDLAAALAEVDVRGAFDALAPSKRKAHVMSVEDAKTPQTRSRRVATVVSELT